MNGLRFASKMQVFDFLDDYARQRKEEIDRRRLGEGHGLIKSYLLETLPNNGGTAPTVPALLDGTGWDVTPIEGDEFYEVRDGRGQLGFIEPLSGRHLALHTTRETREVDGTVRGTVFATSRLDCAWLAGSYFQTIWERLVLPQMPERYVTFKFEHEARFEDAAWDGQEPHDPTDGEWSGEEVLERRASTLAITERSHQVERFLPDLQQAHAPFRAIKMLRIPAPDPPGGYDFWSWGKVTYRAPSFRGGAIPTALHHPLVRTDNADDRAAAVAPGRENQAARRRRDLETHRGAGYVQLRPTATAPHVSEHDCDHV